MYTSEKHKEQKKALIIKAAAQVFADRGFSGTVMADIADRAGIGKGTLYEYFDSKEDLFFAVFEWFTQETEAAAKVSISALGGSVSERLAVLSESVIQSWLEMKDLFTLVMEFWAASASSQMKQRFKGYFRQAYEDFRRIVAALIREGIEHGEFQEDIVPESVAAALVGTWDALLLQAWFDETFDPLTTARNFVAVLIRGLAAEKDDAI
ncbi:MAG: TetR/AcrR family transcriptional regulator [Desulfobacteria bacterium]